MDLISLGMSNAYTNKKVEQLETGITSIENEGDKLIFHLLNGNTVECSIVGLSDENYTLEEKTKLSLLDDNLLKKFSYVNGELLFDGGVVNGDFIDVTTFNFHTNDKTNPHETTIENLTNVSIIDLLDGQVLKYNSLNDTWENGDWEFSGVLSIDKIDTTTLALKTDLDNYLKKDFIDVYTNDINIINKQLEFLHEKELCTITHNLNSYPLAQLIYFNYGAGMSGDIAGGDNGILISHKIEYLNKS